MRTTTVALACCLLAGLAAAQEPGTGAPATTPRTFSLDLDTHPLGSYEASREIRLAVWDSSMTRLEYAAAREMYRGRMGGMAGVDTPMSAAIRMSVAPRMPARLILAGPWSEQWHDLEWKDQVALAAQSAFVIGVLAALAHNLR